MSKIRPSGFSLVELLITLTIMGIVAACTIPPLFRVPASKSNTKYTTMARDTAFMVMTAYEQYRAANATVATTVNIGNLTPYMNYVSVDSTSTIDEYNSIPGGVACAAAGNNCLKLHNGGMLFWSSAVTFAGTNSTNAIYYFFDPDSIQTDSTTNGPGKSVVMWLQYDGEVHSWGTLPANITYFGSTVFAATPSYDPNWFTGF